MQGHPGEPATHELRARDVLRAGNRRGVQQSRPVRRGTIWPSRRTAEPAGRLFGRFGAEVKRRILLGTFVLSAGYYDAYYLKAQKVRTLVRRDFDRAFAEVDVICSPTSPTTAFRLGEKIDDPLSMYLNDVYTLPASLAGIPAMSLPCAPTRAGLPVGLQVMARPFEETTMLAVAAAWEARSPARSLRPQLA
jgi:aspartyl-tRNA(Asn)/glutamyl-tRNA(Gln) amidotransferase subunit A